MAETKKIEFVGDILPRRQIEASQMDTLKSITKSKIQATIEELKARNIGTVKVGHVDMSVAELDATEMRCLEDDIATAACAGSIAHEILMTRLDEIILSVMNAKGLKLGSGKFRGTKGTGQDLAWVLPWINPRLFAFAQGNPAADVGYGIAYAVSNTWQSSFAAAANKTMGTYCTATLIMVGSLAPAMGTTRGFQPCTDALQFVVSNTTYEEVSVADMLFGCGMFGVQGAVGAGMAIGGDNKNRVPITPIPTVTLPPRSVWRMYSRGLGVGTDYLPLGGVFIAPADELSGQAATVPTGAA